MPIPDFGMGCSALGNLYRPMTDEAADAVVRAAIDSGIRYFDVAPHYGFGLAERRLGHALKQTRPAGVMLSTKVGRLLAPTTDTGPRHGFVDADPFEPYFDYGYDAVLRSHEASLGRLDVDRVDVLLAHDLGAMTHGDDAEWRMREFLDGGYRAMADLKADGRISAIGVGVNEVELCDQILNQVPLDIILLAGRYTLLEQGARSLLDRCAALGVQVIIGGPFNSGLLVENPAHGPLHYNYGVAPAAVVDHVARVRAVCDRFGVPLPAAALAYPTRHAAAACVLAGFATPDQVWQAAAWRKVPIPEELWQALRDAGLLHDQPAIA